MICKTKISSLFSDASSDNYRRIADSALGKPVMHNGKQVGIIIGINFDDDLLTVDINDDDYERIFSI